MSDDELPDRALWAQAVGGEPDAFGVLFDRHGERIRAYCARRTGSLDTADDLVSVVFLEAWRRRAEVQLHGDSVLPWLYGVAHHTVQHRWRTTTRHLAEPWPDCRRPASSPTTPTKSLPGWTTSGN